MMLTIATWNVNSIKPRLEHLTGWLKSDKPDIVLLQETKCVDEAFPRLEIEDLGYNVATHGQKTYNGVAILSKFPLEDITKGLPGDDTDEQARYIEAVVSIPSSPRLRGELEGGGNKAAPTLGKIIRVASVYVPNGQEVGSDKYQYKLKFLDRLYAHMKTLLSYGEMLAVGGDYNVAPYDIDAHNPAFWKKTVLAHEAARGGMRKILYLGMYNAMRVCHPHEVNYSWWDYRAGALERDDGLLIDHLLLSPQAADALADCKVERSLRVLEKPSDHAPVVARLAPADVRQ